MGQINNGEMKKLMIVEIIQKNEFRFDCWIIEL